MTKTLVLVRHGQSEWNMLNLFTGWVDVDLTDQGRDEAVSAGQVLTEEGFQFDVLFTSLQKRAILTANAILTELDQDWLPTERSWRLNERHYGALQGLNKLETAEKFGKEQVHTWRRSFDTPPPPLDPDDPGHPRFDPRYRHLAPEALPATECLADVVDRMIPYWVDAIAPRLLNGDRVLVVAHGNSLRALIMFLEHISPADISELNLPTGIPIAYDLDDNLRPSGERRFIGDADAAAAAADAVAKQAG
ncbi:MAG: 2,3-diphosphoglycerate-dependent phosphoglycerate mutase [Acidimicrobiales bacterium]